MPSSSRREFLQHSVLAATGCVAHVLLNASCAPRAQRGRWTAPLNPVITTTPFARLEAIGPDAWAVISTPLAGDRTTFANGGIIAGRSGVVAIEGFYRPAGAAWLAQQARELTGRWPTHVVLTHYHVDHASGVSGYRNADTMPRVHSTAETRQAALAGGPVAPVKDAALERAFADVVVVPGNAPSRIDLGDRVLVLQPFTGHTRSDLTIHDEDAGISWAGDLVWHRMFPNYVDATPTMLAASVRSLAKRLDSSRAVMVPGHGALVTPKGMADYLGLLDSLEAVARAGHAAGTPASQVAASYSVPAALGEWMASKPSVERAITAWYRELA
jgi:glyoxylase-like metal-dependent hydrolase (beta-lactamase superfamily II)